MTNFEYYKDEILKVVNYTGSRFAINHDTGEIISCVGCSCDSCEFGYKKSLRCGREKMCWLYAEHIEKPKLTKKERQFCELFETGWIARDRDGELYHCKCKPYKNDGEWINGSFDINIHNFPDVPFSFITWDDKEPWSVEELLKLEYERNEDSLGAGGEQ